MGWCEGEGGWNNPFFWLSLKARCGVAGFVFNSAVTWNYFFSYICQVNNSFQTMSKLFFPWKNVSPQSGLSKELVIASSTIYVKTWFYYFINLVPVASGCPLVLVSFYLLTNHLGWPFNPWHALNTCCTSGSALSIIFTPWICLFLPFPTCTLAIHVQSLTFRFWRRR